VSDRLRKVLADISPETDTSALPDQGLYRPEQREHVYRAMLERAAPILDGGRTAILDASFTQRTQRDLARSWAAARGVAIRLIEVVCAPEIALHRLGVRSEAGTDPSDAGPSFLATSLARFEPPEEWPPETHQVVRTDETGWEQQLAEQPLGATHRPT
jgi:hypothetical protein